MTAARTSASLNMAHRDDIPSLENSDDESEVLLHVTSTTSGNDGELLVRERLQAPRATLRRLLVAAVVAVAAVVLKLHHSDNGNYQSILLLLTAVGDLKSAHFDHQDDAEAYSLLQKASTKIRGYDALSPAAAAHDERFVPVLEATGYNDNDKDEFGHRRDTIPIAEAVAAEGARSAVFRFQEESSLLETTTNQALELFLSRHAHGIIVRNNPGTLTAASQKKFDDMMRRLSDNGVMVMTHPDVTSTLGAKDSLVKIKDLNCGLDDTQVYYDPESFRKGFRRSIAMQPRVIKQNRGSLGEGIWIVRLKDESQYCIPPEDGECSPIPLDAKVVLMEAWDNHVEYHTVGEFLEFCVHGRTEMSGEWTSTGQGRYFEGGAQAGSLIVDQRFLPRISEGEVRCLFVGSELVEIVHKVPKEGGKWSPLHQICPR